MAIFTIIAIGAALLAGGASYVQAKKAQKKAKKLANSMAGVLLNKESNIEPLPVIYGTRRVGGVRVFISTEGATNEYLYIALALCEGPVASIASIEIDGIPVTDSRFASTVATQLHYGTDDQVRSALLAGASGWTTDHRLRGVAYISVRLKWDQDVFSGVPEITALVTGKKIYDPRTGNTVWSANPALCIRDYLTNTRYGKGLPDSAIDDVAFSAAADDCDSFAVTPYSGATSDIDLFQCNAVIDTGEEIFRNVEKMLLGCRGFLPYIGGKYGLYIDQSKSAILDLGLDNIIGSISFAGEKKEDKFNRVIVKFANPNTEWQEDAAIWPDAGSTEETTYLAEDGGVLLVDEIDMETITNYYAARDFARIFVLRSRNGMRVSLQATSEAMNLIVGDVIRLTHPTPSFTNKPFQVEQVSLNYDGTVNLDLLEYDSTIYSYDLSSEETSYPDTNLPDPFIVAPPTGLTLTESTRVENDGTIVPSVLIQWSAPVDYFINAYEVQYKLSTDSTYKSRITWSTEFDLALPQSGATYNIRVRSINTVGARSSNVSSQISIIGDNAAPGVPTNADVNADSKTLIITWDNPSDSDFSYVEIKRSPNTTESNAVVIAKNDGEAYTDGPFSSGTTYYYWLRAVDRSGNASAWVYAGGDTTTGVIEADLPAGALNTSIYRITTNDSAAPSDVEFNTFAGRLPRENDIALTYDTTQTPNVSYAWEYNGSSWVSIPNLISGDLVVDGSITADKITVDNIESLTSDLGDITAGSLNINSGQFVVTSAGDLTAQSATITGDITANSLTLLPTISISAENLATDGVTLVNSGGQLAIKTNGVDTDQIAAGAVTQNEISVNELSAISADLGSITGGSIDIGSGAFTVSSAGALTATSATITGSVTANTFNLPSGATLVDASNRIINEINKGKTIALLLNKATDGTVNVGEGALVGVSNLGLPVTNTDGFFIWDGVKYTVPRNQYSSGGQGFTFTTSVAGKKGFLVYDIKPNLSPPQATNFNSGGNAVQAAFVWKDGSTWYFDDNQTSTGIAFTPDVYHLALAYLETGTADSIQRGGLLAEPVQLLALSEINADHITVGTVAADRIDVQGIISSFALITESAVINNDIKIGSGESVFKADSNGIYLGNETFANAEFRVTPAGALTATSANISGAVTITSGSININSGQFSVSSAGALIAQSATITGDITANSLSLTPSVSISAANLATDNITLVNSGGQLAIKSGGVDTGQLAIGAVTAPIVAEGAVQGKTLALLLNKNSDGTANSGEGAFVGVNNAGEPVPGTDGFFIFDNVKYNVPRNQVSSVSFATQRLGKKGYVVFDAAGSNFYIQAGGGVFTRIAFVYKEGGTWYYDDNSNPNTFPTPPSFTPGTNHLAIAFLETDPTTQDVILYGGLLAEPVQLTALSEISADYISVGLLNADRIQIDNVTLDTSGGNLIIKGGGVDTQQVSTRAITNTARSDMASNTSYSQSFLSLASLTGQTYANGDIAEISWGLRAHPEASGAPYIAIRVLIYQGATLKATQYFIGDAVYDTTNWAQIQQALFSSSMQYSIPADSTDWRFILQAATNDDGALPQRQFRAPGTYIQAVRLKR